MSDRPEHGRQRQQGRHRHPRPPRDGLGRQEEGEPGHDHEQTWDGWFRGQRSEVSHQVDINMFRDATWKSIEDVMASIKVDQNWP